MEASTVASAEEGNDMALRARPGQQEAAILEDANQPQSGDVAATSGVVATPTSEKPFSFLRLPAEVRNMVYQASYEVPDPEGPGVLDVRGCLRQPEITMVNRQIRREYLPIFYNNHHFFFNLTFLWDRPEDADDGRGLLYPFADMIRAFAPAPSKTLEANNLRFLTCLTVVVDIEEMQEDGIVLVGFTMSSKDKGDEEDMVLATARLDWSNEDRVTQAYINAVEHGFFIGYETVLQMDEPTVAAFHELVDVMCLLASHCPQLTRRVCALVIYEDGWEPESYEIFTDDEA